MSDHEHWVKLNAIRGIVCEGCPRSTEDEVARLTARIAELEAELDIHSRQSSLAIIKRAEAEERLNKLIEADKEHVLHRAVVAMLERDTLRAWAELDEWIAAGRLIVKLDEGCREMVDYMNAMEKIVPKIKTLLKEESK